ncbi:MAG TPA: ProQ/FINO family protein [Stellaceae bacterium]|nr:ProQ/FINO family protein [Stellaceae bacterium]
MGTLTLRPVGAQQARRQPEKGPPGLSPAQARRARGRLVKAIGTLLAERYPAVFLPVGSAPHAPLKVGIDRDLRALHPEVALRTLSITLRRHTAEREYVALPVPGAVRVDLGGRPTGAVSENEADFAAARLRKRPGARGR